MRFVQRQNNGEEETTQTEDQISNDSTGPGFWSAGSGAGATQKDGGMMALVLITVFANQCRHLL